MAAPKGISATSSMAFADYQRPRIRSGPHSLVVDQTLDVTDTDKAKGHVAFDFVIGGPQLSLAAGDVLSVYPPDLARGDFKRVVPHVVLKDPTLPWQRVAQSGNNAPWLILVLRATPGKITTTTVKQSGLSADTAHPDDPVTLIELSKSEVAQLPKLEALRWAAHTRTDTPKPRGGAKRAPVAVSCLLASQLPLPGSVEAPRRIHAYLLSVEQRYEGGSLPDAKQSFPVLYQWSFFCEAHKAGFDTDIVAATTAQDGHATLSLPEAGFADEPVRTRIKAGFVPVEYHTRIGTTEAAWFHGPLLPGAPPRSHAQMDSLLASTLASDFKGNPADALMLYDADCDLFDISYAAAWEMGRLLMLEQTDIAFDLQTWKQKHALARHMAGVDRGVMHAPADAATTPPPHGDWLRTELAHMGALPFDYLVPDPHMLPPNALRFFRVDTGWLECLRDGAMSVGRTDGHLREIDHELRRTLPAIGAMSGFLLRSAAVRDYPDFVIEPYPEVHSGAHPRDHKDLMKILRRDKLGADVLLVLVEGHLREVDLHLHPVGLHFELPDKVETPKATKAPPWINLGDIARTNLRINAQAPDAVARFASQMLHGVPLMRVSWGGAAS